MTASDLISALEKHIDAGNGHDASDYVRKYAHRSGYFSGLLTHLVNESPEARAIIERRIAFHQETV